MYRLCDDQQSTDEGVHCSCRGECRGEEGEISRHSIIKTGEEGREGEEMGEGEVREGGREKSARDGRWNAMSGNH